MVGTVNIVGELSNPDLERFRQYWDRQRQTVSDRSEGGSEVRQLARLPHAASATIDCSR